jgi:protein TonB
MNTALKPYLARSFGIHLLGGIAFLYFANHTSVKADKVYMIDFVGGPTTIVSAGPTSPATASLSSPTPAITAQTDPDAIATTHRRGPIALPRPSLLRGGQESIPEENPTTAPSLAGSRSDSAAETATTASAGSNSAGGAGAGIETDMPNFPYPWYITQIRLMLWQTWQKKMPPIRAEGTVVFSILRNGTYTDLSIESSSGDTSFDKAALESVQSAAPFPALPSDFREPFLKIHLTLKSEETWRS